MKNEILQGLEAIRYNVLNKDDSINNKRISDAIEYISKQSQNEINHDEDKLIELIEYCFKINKAQKKMLESQEIEIESLKLKITRNTIRNENSELRRQLMEKGV